MKKLKKRLISWVLVITMMLGLMPTTVFAANEEKLTDVNLIVPESLTAEADGVTYKYVTGERCTFSYETVPAGLETTQKWNLQDTNGNKLNWETPTMSWTFSGGEWTLELSVTYGEETITKTIYLKEGGESGEGGETPDAPTTEIPFTVSVNGETVELEDGGVDESDNAQYCDTVPKKVIAKVPAGTTSVTIANETANMMIMDTPWHNFLDTGTKSYTAEVGADGAVYCVLTGDYYHLYIEVEEAEEEKLTDVNLIVPESLTAEADGVTYKYVTGERCTFSYETVPAGLETTQKWNLQDTNGNKLNWETPTMSWTFSGGEWTLELSVTYGEDTITKTIYLKEGGESGEGGETPDAPTTEIPFTVSVNGETVELEDGGVDESDKTQYCDVSAPKKVIAKVPAGTTSVTIANETANMMIMDTPWHNFLDTGTKSYTAEVGADGAVYCIQVGDYYHLYIEVEEKEEVKLGSYISITTDMDGEVTVTEEETDMFFPVYKTVVPRGSGYAYFTFPANTIYTFEGSAKVTLRRTGHSPDKLYPAITNVDGSVTVKLLITDIYTGALDEETIACFWKPDGTSVLEGYAFEYSNDMSILLVGLAVGNGYTTNGATYVKNGEDYTFSIDVKNGYDATNMVVKVNGETVTPDENGIYTVEKVTEDLKITVEGVESIPVDGDVTVYFTMEDHDKFVEQGGTVWALEKVTIPYFDLAKYGMEYLYYNPNCYAGGGGQVGGTKETADGVVTLLHMMIWLTEVYYNDVDPEDAGQGLLAEELNWRGFSIHHATAGSAFFNIWDFGYNFNYYLNYEYPLGRPGWGSTCDQIKLSDNDVVTIRYNDNSGNVGTYHHFGENGIVEKSVKQGTNIDLNIYYTGVDNVNYTTPVYKVGEGHKVYMFPEYAVDADPTKGTYVGVTDTDGKVTVNTAELEVGRYYLVSDSTSPAVMLLTIEGEKEPVKATVYGDVNADGVVDIADANFIAGYYNEINDFTEEQLEAADVNGDGIVNIADANLVSSYYNEVIDCFPVEA